MNYHDLAIKVIQGQGSPEEIQLLNDWLEKSEDNRQYYIDITRIHRLSAVLNEDDGFNAEDAWQSVQPRIMEKVHDRSRQRVIYIPFLLRIAAVFILAFLLGGTATYFALRTEMGPEMTGSMNEIVSPKGAKSQVVLPDGTKVWLNAGSKLTYAQSYNTDHREVYLEGEAYFKVKTNRMKPFIVKAQEMSVKALGTAFNVKAYPDENQITTTLVEGKVEIEGFDSESKKFEVTLKPNQQLTYVKKSAQYNLSATVEENEEESAKSEKLKKVRSQAPLTINNGIKTVLFTSWKDEKWIIEGEELGKLITLLERKYNVTFICKSPELRLLRFTGTIRRETLEQALDILKLTAPIKYEIKDGTIIMELDSTRSDSYSKAIQ